jgi:ATP-binding cassette subfamily F protein uup
VRLQAERADAPGQLVFEAKDISKEFGGDLIVRDFSTRVMRGDRIGVMGPNGAGKTTLLRLLLGELKPDAGEVRMGANVQVAYYDQQREQLDPERSVFDTVGDGNDHVTVNGRTRHVNAYLDDFLFPPERAMSPVKSLSGGERNRLLLARLFTRAANVLVLDEPTNDLDLETLELLEAELIEWPGTLLLVSHDRTFLDNVVTSTLVFEGGGKVEDYVGGYDDWLRQRPAVRTSTPESRAASPEPRVPGGETKKLSYREQRELEALPGRIESLEAEQRTLNGKIADPDFYSEPADVIKGAVGRLEALEAELADVYARWDALDARK